MSTEKENASTVLIGLKAHFGVESDEALAARIGVAKSTIATWRRRGTVPTKTARELEARYGLTLKGLGGIEVSNVREHLLRRALYFVIFSMYRNHLNKESVETGEFENIIAHLEPHLKRGLVRAASSESYQGGVGAAAFLLDLKEGKVDAQHLVDDAIAASQTDPTI